MTVTELRHEVTFVFSFAFTCVCDLFYALSFALPFTLPPLKYLGKATEGGNLMTLSIAFKKSLCDQGMTLLNAPKVTFAPLATTSS